MRRVAIVGFALHAEDYPRDWEVVCFNSSWRMVDDYDRLYELHGPLTLDTDSEHLEHLEDTDKPVYAFHPRPEWRAITLDPEPLLERFGRHMTNTVSWIIAHLLSEGVDEIGLWGLDFATPKEFSHERPSVEYMLGFAWGRGVKVTLAPASDLLRCGVLYGVDDDQTYIEHKLLAERHRLLRELSRSDSPSVYSGALDEVESLLCNRYHHGD